MSPCQREGVLKVLDASTKAADSNAHVQDILSQRMQRRVYSTAKSAMTASPRKTSPAQQHMQPQNEGTGPTKEDLCHQEDIEENPPSGRIPIPTLKGLLAIQQVTARKVPYTPQRRQPRRISSGGSDAEDTREDAAPGETPSRTADSPGRPLSELDPGLFPKWHDLDSVPEPVLVAQEAKAKEIKASTEKTEGLEEGPRIDNSQFPVQWLEPTKRLAQRYCFFLPTCRS